MAIVNRDKNVTEQIVDFNVILNATPSGISAGITNPGVSTANTFVLMTVPYPATVVNVGVGYFGLSGSPSHNLWVYRFAGGFTSIQIGASLAVSAFGTSGYQAFSILPAATSFPLQTGDLIALSALTANTAVAQATVTLCLQALQDIKQHFAGPN